MAQPSGRVCGLPSKYRTYLRCSPLICAADSLSILVHLALYLAAFPFRDGIRLLVHQRFGDDEGDEDGIHAIEKMTFIRWMFFIFGTLGPGIKLMAMEGVKVTKAWGAMFLLSFVMVEALVILSWIYGDDHDAVLESHYAEKLQDIKAKLSEVDRDLFQEFAAGLYGVILLLVAIDIHEGFHHRFLHSFPPPPPPRF